MKLSQSCDDEMWDWLLLLGWRASSVRNDRRKYIVLPLDTFSRLKAANANDRARILESLLESTRSAA